MIIIIRRFQRISDGCDDHIHYILMRYIIYVVYSLRSRKCKKGQMFSLYYLFHDILSCMLLIIELTYYNTIIK